jgi:hypothetical protein
MRPQVRGQALIGGIRLGREDQVGQLVFQAAPRHGQTMPADLPRHVTVTEVEPGPEQLSYPAWETDDSPRCYRRHLVGTQ